jgi:hypothetical protein
MPLSKVIVEREELQSNKRSIRIMTFAVVLINFAVLMYIALQLMRCGK